VEIALDSSTALHERPKPQVRWYVAQSIEACSFHRCAREVDVGHGLGGGGGLDTLDSLQEPEPSRS